MYKSVEFNLSGQFAFFKKPDVNEKERFFTFACIHKVALNGLLGAIIGLAGYQRSNKKDLTTEFKPKQQKPKVIPEFRRRNRKEVNTEAQRSNKKGVIPEFQEKLKNLKVSITPLNEYAYISKHMSNFNNTTGFASREAGGVMVVHEQWLESPKWKIRLITDESYYKDNNIEIEVDILNLLENYLVNRKCVFNPYLGTNSHPAIVSDVCIKEMEESLFEEGDELHCLCLVREDDFETIGVEISNKINSVQYYKYRECLPMGLESKFARYEYEYVMATNRKLIAKNNINLYKIDNELINFI